MPYQTLSLVRRPPLAIITLTRPASGNRIDRAMLGELKAAMESADGDQEIRAVILTGADDVFCLGWNAGLLDELRQGGIETAEPGLLGSTFQFLVESPRPVIAALNGPALSAGFELALACDVRLASATGRLGLPDVAEGRIPMAGGTQRLTRIAGPARATELILTGRVLSAAEAVDWGILSASCEPRELLPSALRFGAEIAQRGPLAVRLAKEAVHRGSDMPLQQALRYETDLTVLLQTTADRAEGVRAFVEKRNPSFEGR